jgi:hypothetical protein
MYSCYEYTLLWSVQSLQILSLIPLPPTPYFQQLSIHIVISSTSTDVIFHDITVALSFSFPFSLSSNSIKFYCYKHVLYISLYMIMLVLCICLFFGSIFHIWEKKMWLLSFWTWLTSLNMSPPNASIYLQVTCHYSLWLSATPLCIISQFLDPFISCRAPGLFP